MTTVEDVKKQADHNLPNAQELSTMSNVMIPEEIQQWKTEQLQENISRRTNSSAQEELRTHRLKTTEGIEERDS